jgi:hypothetical protein
MFEGETDHPTWDGPMNSEPPSDTRHTQGEGATAPDSDSQSQSQNGKGDWKSIAMITGVLLVAERSACFLYLRPESGSEPPASIRWPVPLQQAADARERQDRLAYSQAVDRAAQVVECVLQNFLRGGRDRCLGHWPSRADPIQ